MVDSSSLIRNMTDSSYQISTELVIIGAGIAGLAAADHLIKAGTNDFLIVEATDRIGGRIHSVPYGTGYLELGAQFIHGQEGNPVYEMAAKLKLIKPLGLFEKFYKNVTGYWDDDNDLFMTADGTEVPYKLLEKVIMMIDNIETSMSKLPAGQHGYSSSGHFFRDQFEEKLKGLKLNENEVKLARGIYRWVRFLENTDSGCDTMDVLHLDGYNAYKECPGQPFTELKPSFSHVLKPFLDAIPSEKILLNKQVSTIRLQTTGKNNRYVAVECQDGTRLQAEYAIITLPLGVLKSEFQTLFQPPLPQFKADVINRFGFGTIGKIFLHFPHIFWDTEVDGYEFIPNENAEELLLSQPMSEVWHKAILGFGTLEGHPNILEAFLFGSGSAYMETLSDDVIAETCVSLLRSYLNKPDIPMPTQVIKTVWKNNTHFQGTYSHITTDGKVEDPDLLAKPLPDDENPRLMFAGEATHSCYYSTTHGALLSGVREAKRFVALKSRKQ